MALDIRGMAPLLQTYAHFVAAGIKAEPPKVAPYGMKQLHATDPDGYGNVAQTTLGGVAQLAGATLKR